MKEPNFIQKLIRKISILFRSEKSRLRTEKRIKEYNCKLCKDRGMCPHTCESCVWKI